MRIKTSRIFLILNSLILLGLCVLEPSLCAGQQWRQRQQEQRALRGNGAGQKTLQEVKDLYFKARTPQDLEDADRKSVV